MDKVIYNALYFEKDCVKSPNLKIKEKDNIEPYLKSSFVSLMSVKYQNPECDIILIINDSLPLEYETLFLQNSIQVRRVKFDHYRVPKNFKWEYAFYKLKALEYMVNETEYQYLLGLDTDVYAGGGLEQLWKECEFNIPVLLTLTSCISELMRKNIIEDYEKNFEKKKPIPLIGGEFIGGSKTALHILWRKINDIYEQIEKNGFRISENSGDEALLSMAASELNIASASPFIRRYWTRRAYYDVDTRWERTALWHLPAEKNYGFIKLFDILVKTKKFPSNEKLASMFNLPKQNKYNISMLKYYFFNLLNRL